MSMDVMSSPAAFTGLHATAAEGVRRASRGYAAEAAKLSSGKVDVATFVEAKQQTTLYSLNLKLLKMSDEMVGSVIDLLA